MSPKPTTPPPSTPPGPAAGGDGLAVGLAKIALALRSRSWSEGHRRGLTPTQGQVLAHLAGRPGATLDEVAAALGVRASTASEAVQTLAEKGLVLRERDPGDRRRLSLGLTAAGRAEAAAAALWPDFLARAAGELTPEEAAALSRGLQKMLAALLDAGEIQAARLCLTCRFFRPHRHADPDAPHHCAFIDRPFGDGGLRFDCPDHQTAEAAEAAASRAAFRAPAPPP